MPRISGHIRIFSFQGRRAWFQLPTSPHGSRVYSEELLVLYVCRRVLSAQRLAFSSVHRYTKQYLQEDGQVRFGA